jgi:RNA polymerase sigma-70 factor (ECF subfamily)
MMNSADEEVMLQVRDGAPERLGILFDRYHHALFNFYCRSIGDRAASEDLVQDVFYRILKYRHTYRIGIRFRTWMYRIARNARLDRMKKQASDTALEVEMQPAPELSDSLQRQQENALLHRALMQLSPEKREALVLSRFQDLDYREISDVLGCEVGAVKVRIFRALRELRDILRQLEEESISRNKNSQGIFGVES